MESVEQVTQAEQAKQQAIQAYYEMMTTTEFVGNARFNKCTNDVKKFVSSEEFKRIEKDAREKCLQIATSKYTKHYSGTAIMNDDELHIVKLAIEAMDGSLNRLYREAKANVRTQNDNKAIRVF
jgi:hypothetical protein